MSTPAAADEINSAEKCQTQEGEQPSQSTGLNVGKTSLTVMPLSHRKQTSAGVKRKADNNEDESPHKRGRYLSTEILEPDILFVASDINSSKETRGCENKMPMSSEESDVEKCDHYLHDLIMSCSCSQVIKLLEDNHCFSQDTLDKALILACQSGHKHTAKKLIDHGANVCCRDPDGNTPLMISSQNWFVNNDVAINRNTNNGNDINRITDNWRDEESTDTLMQAIRCSRTPVVLEVIKNTPDVNVRDHKGNTALLHAINRIPVYGRAYGVDQIVTALVNAGCDVNWQNSDGISPLMLGSNRYSKEVIKILLDAGADVNAVSKTDRTKTALSYFQTTNFITDEDITGCMSHFLSRGACLSYLQTKMFHRILLCNNIDIISKVITNGSGPLSIRSDKYFHLFLPASRIFDVSPLCTALFGGHISLARHFIEIMFLTKYDVSALMYNRTLRFYLNRYHLSQCLDLLDEMSSQPMSLISLAFVTVSSAVRTTS